MSELRKDLNFSKFDDGGVSNVGTVGRGDEGTGSKGREDLPFWPFIFSSDSFSIRSGEATKVSLLIPDEPNGGKFVEFRAEMGVGESSENRGVERVSVDSFSLILLMFAYRRTDWSKGGTKSNAKIKII